jgi:hypothetical protein
MNSKECLILYISYHSINQIGFSNQRVVSCSGHLFALTAEGESLSVFGILGRDSILSD